ncbi:unnamed protein product [Mucor hiemalis]
MQYTCNRLSAELRQYHHDTVSGIVKPKKLLGRYSPPAQEDYQAYFLYLSKDWRNGDLSVKTDEQQDAFNVGSSQSSALRSNDTVSYNCDEEEVGNENESEGLEDESTRLIDIAGTPLGFTKRMLPEIIKYLSSYESAHRFNSPASISIDSFTSLLESTSRTHDAIGDSIENDYIIFQRQKEFFFQQILKVYVTNFIELKDELFAAKGGLGTKKAGFLKKQSSQTLHTIKSLIKVYNEEISFLINTVPSEFSSLKLDVVNDKTSKFFAPNVPTELKPFMRWKSLCAELILLQNKSNI